MARPAYRYALHLIDPDGRSIGQVPVNIDWSGAIEWARFQAIRQGVLPPRMTPETNHAIEPDWHPTLGEPYASGFRVTVFGREGRHAACDIPTIYLRELAAAAVRQLTAEDDPRRNRTFKYLAMAFPCEAPRHEEAPPARFSVEGADRPIPLREQCWSDRSAGAEPFGDAHELDMPVLMQRAVLEEALAMTSEAGIDEAGGVLIGHLCRDPGPVGIFAEITAQVPVRHAVSTMTRLTFTADTWAAANAAVKLRRRGEVFLGWWHSHPFLKETCKDCEKRRDGTCTENGLFLSPEDCALHRTVFPRAWSVALVVSDSPCSGLMWAMFGYRHGMLASRGYSLVPPPASADEDRAASPAHGGNAHGSSG